MSRLEFSRKTKAAIIASPFVTPPSAPLPILGRKPPMPTNEADIRNAALEEAARLIEEGYDRPGIATKRDKCAHGQFGWEDCVSCAAAAIRALKSDADPAPERHRARKAGEE